MFTLRDLNKQGKASLLGLSFFGLLALKVAAQAPTPSVPADAPTQVTFHLNFVGSNDPVKLTHVMLGDKDVPFDTPVSVSGQWLRTIGIVVQNISPKPVICGDVLLLYSEAGNNTPDKPTLSSDRQLGRIPPHWYMQKDGTERPRGDDAQEPEINVLPGASMTFTIRGINHTIGDQDQAAAYKLVGHHIQIEIILYQFFFSDGDTWSRGTFYSPADPPTVWRKMTPAEFFGSTPPVNR
jgi:hypothetical protein